MNLFIALKGVAYLNSHNQITWAERTFVHVHLTKIQISLRIPTVWPESSLGAFWIARDATFLHADNKDSDQTAHMSAGTFFLML